MSDLKPLILHGHPGPNPWKVAILLEELHIPYTTRIYTTPELKQPSFLAINPNGMAPVIEDPNTDLLLAESGAIIDYILEQYDTDHRLSFPSLPEKYLLKQWVQFQATTHGPLLQHIFRWTFTDPLPDARARYIQDFRRVLGLLNAELADKEWLVGGKCSAADLSHVPFQSRVAAIMGADAPDMAREFPRVEAWLKRMVGRGTVAKVLRERDEAGRVLAGRQGG